MRHFTTRITNVKEKHIFDFPHTHTHCQSTACPSEDLLCGSDDLNGQEKRIQHLFNISVGVSDLRILSYRVEKPQNISELPLPFSKNFKFNSWRKERVDISTHRKGGGLQSEVELMYVTMWIHMYASIQQKTESLQQKQQQKQQQQ